MDVPHTHGVTCWLCCWAAVFQHCALCVLAVLMAVFMRGQKTDRMLPLGLVRAQRVYHIKGSPFVRAHDASYCGNPGICPKYAQGQKSKKRPPTRDTQHGSRPNLRQRDPGSICAHPLMTFRINVRARHKRCVPKKRQKGQLYVYICIGRETNESGRLQP